MLTEIEHAAQWWASQLSKCTEQQTLAFKQALMVELSTRYAGHWFADDAQRGCAYRCISYDHRMDSTLIRAAATAQISNNLETSLNKARWHSMFVNPGLVKVQNTKNIATSPIIVYPTSSDVPPTSTKATTLTPCQTPRRSSVQPTPVARTVSFSAPVIKVTPVDDETPISTSSINGLAPSLMPPSLPKKSALKGHHRSQSTSPVAAPLSVRFTNAMNPDAATFVPKSQSPPPAQVLKPASPPPTNTTAPSSPPSGSTLALPNRDTSPKAVHHSSRSVDLNSAIFADLTLTAKPSARTTPVTVTVTPAPSTTPAPSSENTDRLSALPTVFAHMTRINKPSHHISHSMFSFPQGLSTLNTSNWSPTQPLSSPTTIPSPTSLSLPTRLVSHHRGLSASLLPSALLVR